MLNLTSGRSAIGALQCGDVKHDGYRLQVRGMATGAPDHPPRLRLRDVRRVAKTATQWIAIASILTEGGPALRQALALCHDADDARCKRQKLPVADKRLVGHVRIGHPYDRESEK
jgi:hypothetical protein